MTMNDFRTIVAALVTAASLALALHLIQAQAADESLPPPGRLPIRHDCGISAPFGGPVVPLV